jgi:asparagine synthase (glutamine-hydrolysing)
MSGICGLFNPNNEPVAEAEVRVMTSMLEQRGPDGTRWNCNGPIGLGHTLLGTTPELLFESQPYRHADTRCIITADVRLDNRIELLDVLGQIKRQGSIGDAELILLAYLKWSDACVDHLLGDFAFAIYDPRYKKMFCARDHSGMRPFYYHSVPGQRFIFASDARAILVLPQVPYQINQGRIADFLIPQLEWIDYTSTFFEGICRLPPAHTLTVTSTSVGVVEYWKPLPQPDSSPQSDENYTEGFLEAFTGAVKARLRAPGNIVGSMLSGGMDSGSVVAVARELLSERQGGPLMTYSAARRSDADCDESRSIYAAINVPSISPNLIHPDALGGIHESLLSGLEEPYDGQFLILKSIYLAARDAGQSVVLDGGAGDVVLAAGSYFVRLIKQRKLRLAMAEIVAKKNFWDGTSFFGDVFRYSRAALVPEAVKVRLRPIRYRRNVTEYLQDSLISDDFSESVDIRGRFERLRQMFPDGWIPDYAVERCNVIRPNVTGGRERYGRLAASAATEASDPFLDKRVIEFCARLPGSARLRQGWPKMILREAMSGMIPDEVRWFRGKPHLGCLFNEVVTRHSLERGEISLSGLREDLENYVDPSSLTKAWRHFINGDEADSIHTANILSIWLRENANRPIVPEQLIG